MTRVEDFRREIRHILEGVSKKELPRGAFFKATIRPQEGKALFFPSEIGSSYIRARKILRAKSEDTDKSISDTELENLLDDFLIDFKYGDERKNLAEIDKHIRDLFSKLKGLRSEKYLFLIPIMHCSLRQDIIIGASTLTNLNEQFLASLESKYALEMRYFKEDLSKTVTELKKNETSIFAIVMVEASDYEKALELAIKKADMCLNVLRIYYFDAPFLIRDDFRCPFTRTIGHANIDTKSFGIPLSNLNIVTNIRSINAEAIEEMKQNGLEIINKLLCKDKDERTALQNNILTSIFWYGNAVKETQKDMKFIKSITALETLLVPDGGIGKGDRLSKRFASILYAEASDEEKKESFLHMRYLYGIRNEIIHSGEGYVYEEDLNQIMLWTQVLIQFLLRYVEKFNKLEELIAKEFPVDDDLYQDL